MLGKLLAMKCMLIVCLLGKENLDYQGPVVRKAFNLNGV